MMNNMMHKIFSTREREKILDYMNLSKLHWVRAVAKTLKISVNSVSKFLSLLNSIKILRRRGNEDPFIKDIMKNGVKINLI